MKELNHIIFPVLSEEDLIEYINDEKGNIPDMLQIIMHNQKVIFNKLKEIKS